MAWTIGDLHDERRIMAVLERDPAWAAYAICDLSPPNRQFSRFVGAPANASLDAVVLLFAMPGFRTILPAGDAAGVTAIMRQVEGLPATVSLSVRPEDLPAIALRYQPGEPWIMLRMVVTPAAARAAVVPEGAELRRLDPSFTDALAALYQRSDAAVFAANMLEHGVFFGTFEGEQLVAVAGTHTVSKRYRIGCVGGVFTEPAHRGQGLAQATTSAVVQALLAEGIELIALNVRADNAPAVAAYRKLGFVEHCRFWEGEAVLRR